VHALRFAARVEHQQAQRLLRALLALGHGALAPEQAHRGVVAGLELLEVVIRDVDVRPATSNVAAVFFDEKNPLQPPNVGAARATTRRMRSTRIICAVPRTLATVSSAWSRVEVDVVLLGHEGLRRVDLRL